MHVKVSSAKWRPFLLGLIVLKIGHQHIAMQVMATSATLHIDINYSKQQYNAGRQPEIWLTIRGEPDTYHCLRAKLYMLFIYAFLNQT